MFNTLDQYVFGHAPYPGTQATSAPAAPASVLSRDTQGDRNVRDAEPEREDLESTRFPTGDPTPPSDLLLSAPTFAHQLDLTPGPQQGVSFDARLEKPPRTEGNEIVTPARFG